MSVVRLDVMTTDVVTTIVASDERNVNKFDQSCGFAVILVGSNAIHGAGTTSQATTALIQIGGRSPILEHDVELRLSLKFSEIGLRQGY